MPLTAKGIEILSAMEKEYGAKRGKEVFYASRNKGTISGVDSMGTFDPAASPATGGYALVDAKADAQKVEAGDYIVHKTTGEVGRVIEVDEDMALVRWNRSGNETRVATNKLKHGGS